MGDSAGTVLSTRQEQELGAAFMRRLRQQANFVDDPELNDYIKDLGARLVANIAVQPFPFTFFIVRDPTLNAFAAPGGFIGIHSGLLLAARNESELAAVLAHEIAHVTQRHMARAYEAAGKLTLPTAAAMLAAVLLGTQSSEAGQAAFMAIQAGSAQYQINFTRTNEREADSIGIKVLSRSGFDTRGMADFFERMALGNRYTGGRPPAFLSTHPVTTDRIAEAQSRAAGLPSNTKQDNVRFEHAKTRLAVSDEHNPRVLVDDYRRKIRKNPQADSIRLTRYGLALSLQRIGEIEESRSLLKNLIKDAPDQIAYRIALAQLELEAGRPNDALAGLGKAVDLYPGNQSLELLRARALIATGNPRKAKIRLEKFIRNSPNETPLPYRLLARVADEMDLPAERHQAMAEYYYLNGQTGAAVEQLETGLRIPGLGFFETARMEDRLAGFRAELKDNRVSKEQK